MRYPAALKAHDLITSPAFVVIKAAPTLAGHWTASAAVGRRVSPGSHVCFR